MGSKMLSTSLGLAFLLSIGVTHSAKALEADCFVQPPNAVPIPCLADSAGHQIISTAPLVAATTNKSTGVLAGGSFQLIAGATGTRKSLEFTNTCNVAANCVSVTDMCYLYFASDNTPSLVSSIVIPPTYTYIRSEGVVPQEAVYATCDGTGDTFRYVEQ